MIYEPQFSTGVPISILIKYNNNTTLYKLVLLQTAVRLNEKEYFEEIKFCKNHFC